MIRLSRKNNVARVMLKPYPDITAVVVDAKPQHQHKLPLVQNSLVLGELPTGQVRQAKFYLGVCLVVFSSPEPKAHR